MESLADAGNRDYFNPQILQGRAHIVFGNKNPLEANLAGFLDPGLDLVDPADFPGQADFPNKAVGRGDFLVIVTGGNGHGDGQIDSWFV